MAGVVIYTMVTSVTMFALLLGGLCAVASGNGINQSWNEYDLHRHIFKRYNPDVVPRINNTNPIMVDLEFYLMSIDDVDVKQQTVAARAFMSVMWKDELLDWDTDLYPGVTTINVRNEAIWVPDLSLTGTQDDILDYGQEKGRAKITDNGTVTMWPYKLYTVACKITITKFPWDEHQCMFGFSSWTHTTSVIRLRNPSGRIDLHRQITESGGWDVTALDSRKWTSTFHCSSYDHVEFNFRFRRKWLFHILNTVMPTVCISLLNILCFVLPAQGGDRITLGISIFLSLAVFLTVLNKTTPDSSDEVSIFNIYVCLQLLGGALTNLMTVVSLYCLHKQNTAPIPFPMRLIVKISCIMLTFTVRKTERVIHQEGIRMVLKERKEPVQTVTWSMVSRALDRVCLVCAICWHIALNLYLALGIVM